MPIKTDARTNLSYTKAILVRTATGIENKIFFKKKGLSISIDNNNFQKKVLEWI